MRKKNDTVRYTAKQIKSKMERGEDRTDWRKAKAMTGKKLEASIRADVDDVRGEPDWTQAIMGVPAPKDHINIRIDHDVLEWFRAKVPVTPLEEFLETGFLSFIQQWPLRNRRHFHNV